MRIKVEERSGHLVIRKAYGDLLTEMGRPRKPGFPDFGKSFPGLPELKPFRDTFGEVLQDQIRGDRVSQGGEIRARVKAKLGVGDAIDAKAEDDGCPVVTDAFRFKQDTRKFGAADQQVVRPFQLAKMVGSRCPVDRFGKGNSRQ